VVSSDFVKNLLIEQRKRLLGTVLGHVDRELASSLTPRQKADLRDKVMAAVGVYHDTCLDMLKASVDDGIIPNAELLSVLESLHSDVKGLSSEMRQIRGGR
jgi:hypothetical protein